MIPVRESIAGAVVPDPTRLPLRVRVVRPEVVVAVPVTPPLTVTLLAVAVVAPAVKVAVEPLPPSILMAELIVSV